MNTEFEITATDEMNISARAQAMADFTQDERRVFTLESLILAWSLANNVTMTGKH